MWIKICANTTLEDAQLAAEAGANAVGFIFAPSPRQVTPDAVRAITPRLPRNVEKYGVFVNAGFEEIVETVQHAGLTGVQLHSSNESGLALRLREHFAELPVRGRLGLLHVLHYGPAFAAQMLELRQDHAVDAVLVDSRTARAVGGTGLRFDWQAASRSFLAAAPHLRLVAAGGLSPENVAEAIYTLQPWGVDVSSGVEAAPGRKDTARVREFVAAARAAFAQTKAMPGMA